MKNTSFGFGYGRFGILWCMAILLLAMFPVKALLAGQEQVDCPPLAGAQGVDKCSLSEAHPTEICKLLTNKTASEKAQIKSREIAKRDFKGEYTNTQYGVRVEIIGEVKEININGQSGIELFAKAWRGTQQLGFGKDGSVEIERFRIFNPPILVDDPNGDIVREWTDIDGIPHTRKLREDPVEAIRQVIAHNVGLVGKENTQIVIGKIGNTTSTFYPDAGTVGTTVDGHASRTGVVENWATLRGGAGTGVSNSTLPLYAYLLSHTTSGQYQQLARSIFLFDTSTIGTDTIVSTTLSLYSTEVIDSFNSAGALAIVESTPASNNVLVAGDFTNVGSTLQASTILISAMTVNTYSTWTLNATGLSNISKTGITKFGLRLEADRSNTEPTWVSNVYQGISWASADNAGTASDPKLVVVHSAPTSSGTITRVVNGGGSILGASSLTMNFNITGSNLILFVSTFKQNSETITGVTWNGVPLTQVESVISYTTNNVQLWYLLAPAVGTHDLITTASGSSGYIITDYTLYSGVKQTGQLDGSTRVTGNTPITATITTGTDNTWAFLTAVQGGSAGTNATLIAAGDKPTYDNQGYGTIAPGTAFSMTVNLQPGNTGGVIMATFKDATPTATPTPTPTPTPSTSDTTAPTNTSITINSGASYTNSTAVTLTLSATDSVGVTGYYLSTSSSTPVASASGWNSVTSTTSYSGSASYPLTSGDEQKTVYVWYKDAAGNVSSSASDSITLDTTAPIVTITSPTSSDTYTATSNTVSLSGSASDSTSGVKEVTLSNDKGGSGDASGTTNWSISNMSLSNGDNVITVTATDNAGNPGTDTITVIVPASTPAPSPTPTPATTPVPTPTPTEKGAIVGTVADEAAGVGITGAKIILDKGGYSATTGVDGSYTIVDVSAGNYTLTVSADGYKSSSQTVTVYAGEATVADFLLKRASGAMVFGFVLDENGDSLKGVAVTITGWGNNQLQGTETDDDGYYEFRDLEAGGNTLTFEKIGYRTQTLDIILKAEESLEAETITMELEVKGSIFGYVVDIYGNPIESVNLKLKGINTRIKRNASSDADGFFEFADLDADKYVIFASKKRYKKTKQTVSLDEGDDQKIEIEMRKSSSSRRVIPEAEE